MMSILFHDVYAEIGHKLHTGKFDLIEFFELVYADDTMLIGKRGQELNILLHCIEKHSQVRNEIQQNQVQFHRNEQAGDNPL